MSTYPPQRCGIATFTAALREGFDGSEVVSLSKSVDPGGRQAPVHHVIRSESSSDPKSVAHALDACDISVVSVQHEYGIWGPNDGENVLRFLDAVSMPAVTTLHTVLLRPSPSQSRIMEGILDASAAVVVMSRSAASILVERYGADPGRVQVIPHGVPDLAMVSPDTVKPKLGFGGRHIVLSFGLVGPGKGYESVIEAMPAVIGAQSDTQYVIVGMTHPDLLRQEGERYRDGLEGLAAELGVSDHITFVDRFVDDAELQEWLMSADVFVTPYPNLDQIVSGTLSYALAAGKAVVSTPYLYATELLSDGDGVLLDSTTPTAMASALIELLHDDERRSMLARRAYQRGRGMLWPTVADAYRRLFDRVRSTSAPPGPASIPIRPSTRGSWTVKVGPAELLPPPARAHLVVLDAGMGIMQHANGGRPNPDHGLCTDDVARAIGVDLLHRRVMGWPSVERSVERGLRFLEQAYQPETGRFRNLRRIDGGWPAVPGSEDADARALHALAEIVAEAPSGSIRTTAADLFERALPGASRSTSIRPQATLMLACDAAARAGLESMVSDSYRRTSERLWQTFVAARSSDWPWPEDVVTYENELPPMALIVAGRTLDRPEMVDTGLAVLDWLIDAQLDPAGYLSVIGNDGWWPKAGTPARFDQQPISVTSMLLACEVAHEATGMPRYRTIAEMAYQWFLGRNALSRPVAIPETGACHDGIGPHGVNLNQGAESTLMWHLAMEHVRRMQVRAIPATQPAHDSLAPTV